MTAPRDGDSSEDGTLAQIIPLRRRAGDPDLSELAHGFQRTDVFDPPPEPLPAREYSVWENPTAELIRREPPKHHVLPALVRAARATQQRIRRPRSLTAATALTAAVAVGLLALTLIAHHAQPRRTVPRGGSSLAATSPSHPSAAKTATLPRRSSGHHAATARASHPRTAARRQPQHRHVSKPHAAEAVTAPPATASVSAEAPSSEQAPAAAASPAAYAPTVEQHTESTMARAAREFGFER